MRLGPEVTRERRIINAISPAATNTRINPPINKSFERPPVSGETNARARAGMLLLADAVSTLDDDVVIMAM